MKYITLSDLSATIRSNLHKVPHDIDFIVGIPRSGLLPATIIASYLNVPLIDINSFLHNETPNGGERLRYFNRDHVKTNKVLVVDDTVYNGTEMKRARQKLSVLTDYEFIYLCAYLEGNGDEFVDIYLEDIRSETKCFANIVFYEWNIMQHYENYTKHFLFDFDGVFCPDPPDERNEDEYLNYIKNAPPLFIPKSQIGGIITYRLNKNKEITENWLRNHSIKYNDLVMFDANDWNERHNSGISPQVHKATYYSQHNEYELFIESDDSQARDISLLSKKPVYCVQTNKIYQ